MWSQADLIVIISYIVWGACRFTPCVNSSLIAFCHCPFVLYSPMAQWLPSCSPSPCFGASLMFMICSWGFWHYATSRAWSLFLPLFLFLFLWGPEPALSLFSLLPSPVVMKLRLQLVSILDSWLSMYLCNHSVLSLWMKHMPSLLHIVLNDINQQHWITFFSCLLLSLNNSSKWESDSIHTGEPNFEQHHFAPTSFSSRSMGLSMTRAPDEGPSWPRL